ncbi:MAG: hypothetical protein LBS81_00320 [Endomicrobium sp.]|nr:hypothetical protein [Endomicrobium sp.]
MTLKGENRTNKGFILSAYASEDINITISLPDGWAFSDKELHCRRRNLSGKSIR